MMRIIVTTIDGCPVEGFELNVENYSQNALKCVINAFATMGIEFETEQKTNGTFIRSIGYQRSTEDWHWNIALEDIGGTVNSSEVGIDAIDLKDVVTIAFIATRTDNSNNTQHGDDWTC